MRCSPLLALLLLTAFGCRITPTFESAAGTGGGPPGGAAAPDDGAAADAAGRGGAGMPATGGSAASGASAATGGGGTSRGGSSSLGGGGARSGAGASPSGGEAGETGGNAAEPAASSGGAGASPPVACDAQTVTFDELRAGEVRDDVKVRLDAVATSQKFLVSHAQSGRCLFGAFVGTEPAADGPRGVLVVSYGDDAPADEPCAPDRDALPDDLAPGDVVAGVGYVSPYAPSTCSGTAPSPQLMLDAGCPLARAGRRMLPAPYDLSPDEATALARGIDAALVRRFAGGLVRLEGLHTLRPEEGEGSVGPYGVVRFVETTLELHNDLEYGDLTLGGPGDAAKSLAIAYPASFSSVTGVVYLDYCSWALTPRSRCTDLDPPSTNCR